MSLRLGTKRRQTEFEAAAAAKEEEDEEEDEKEEEEIILSLLGFFPGESFPARFSPPTYHRADKDAQPLNRRPGEHLSLLAHFHPDSL